MTIPAAYASHRNLAKSYARGFRAGTIAGLGGAPLPPYTKPRMRGAFKAGFKDGQRAKDQPANPRSGDGADAFAYAATAIGFDLGRGDDWQVTMMRQRVVPARERELLAFLERLHKDITALLHGGF